ncbi:MAG: alpha/beta hydrolase [Phreatobacter sp.]|uniref:alpha/beta hydrolase n=1 Tax=Phreatobacter sp. TaxID=1966341 RepID=UPI001A3EFAF6|nr:alpha/beta hydrolase [Phreatobacter sp.]MBL8568695.1 alpha/beta hydrolase [Phreatobacter sp.]
MTQIDLEAEYNNRARVPEHPAIIAGWAADAAAFRAARGDAKLDEAYGTGERHRYDWFPAASPRAGAPVLLFIHGGYWQALDKGFFSHLAAGANAHGLDVAVMSYDLCPQVALGEIVDQSIACARELHRRTGRKVLPFGHSAGGHLAACLAGANWPWIGEAASIIAAAMPVSGLFHLAPLVRTSINKALGMDVGQASRASPLVWSPPEGLKVTAVVGGEESSEYHRQTRALVDAWRPMGVVTKEIVVDGANHFTVIAPFADPASMLTAELVRLAD